jgi:hypothetical protein
MLFISFPIFSLTNQEFDEFFFNISKKAPLISALRRETKKRKPHWIPDWAVPVFFGKLAPCVAFDPCSGCTSLEIAVLICWEFPDSELSWSCLMDAVRWIPWVLFTDPAFPPWHLWTSPLRSHSWEHLQQSVLGCWHHSHSITEGWQSPGICFSHGWSLFQYCLRQSYKD